MQTKTVIVTVAAVAVVLLAAGAVRADVFNMGGGMTSLTFVPVGNPGNAPDVNLDHSGNPLGSVGHTYQMGAYDVTAAQYCQFLNSVATTSDPYGLYTYLMIDGLAPAKCGIQQTGTPGNYSYSLTKNGNFPVNFVSWGDAARFANWLTNGQPTAAEGASTTETGSYTLNGAVTDAALMDVTRNANAKYVIPTENECYKAAYYDPTLNVGAGGYWQYPTKSNTVPTNVLSATGTNNASYYDSNGTGNGGYTDPTNYLTVVGAFAASPGPYGTYDMGGDVFQWNEANISGPIRGISGPFRGMRGGWFGGGDPQLQAAYSYSNYAYPTDEDYLIGFRVSVPEPATMLVLVSGSIGMLMKRRA